MPANSRNPKWLRDIDASLAIRSQFVLFGNVRDHVLTYDRSQAAKTLVEAVWSILEPRGFRGILVWDPIDGLREFPDNWGMEAAVGSLAKPGRKTPDDVARLMHVVTAPEPEAGRPPVAMLIDLASRFASRDSGLLQNPQKLFTAAEKAAAASLLVSRADASLRSYFNPILWIANRANDLPFWFTADSQRIASVPVPLPSAEDRRFWAEVCFDYIREEDRDVDRERFGRTLAGMTHGMTLADIEDIACIAEANGVKASEVDDAVERFRAGDVADDENPWRSSELRRRIVGGAGEIDRYVKGQARAKSRVLDILKRTSVGLTGAQASSSAGRPRGVMFFAGPTGVGKTEMAKTIARIVFNDPDACLRFDMSEFKGEHSGDRLIGAPPGYVGFDQGGELTNAIRENPFRVLLFDEIEKAHPRILDKFLQVLEDGRLTDGRGETVYFSESLIVFTSNVGVLREVEVVRDGRRYREVERLVTREDQSGDSEEYEKKILSGVKHHFHYELQRPELHNRLGENIVVFNYIVEDVAADILDAMTGNVAEACREDASLELELTADAREQLLEMCTQGDILDNGGRGIGSKLEAVLVNPLARHIFDNDIREGRLEVTGFELDRRNSAYGIVAEHLP